MTNAISLMLTVKMGMMKTVMVIATTAADQMTTKWGNPQMTNAISLILTVKMGMMKQ